MKDSISESLVRDILSEYKIRPDYIEPMGKVYKIYSDGHAYGLKMIQLNERNFFRKIQYLYSKGYYRFVPIYTTKNGSYYVLRNQKLYYLMPWLPNNERVNSNEKLRKMFRELARLHSVTVKEIDVDKEATKTHYEKTKLQWQRELEFINQFMNLCEQKWYPSPFEWEFMQYFNEIQKAYEYALRTLDRWDEVIEKKEKVRTVLVHGKLAPEHFVFDDRGYGHFINLEQTQTSSPFRDLLPFLARALKTYPNQSGEGIEWIFTYMNHYPLREEEKLLFKSYLAHPGHFVHLIRKYLEKNHPNHELKFTKRLQKNYWQFKNIEFIVMRMEEMEKQQHQANE